MLLGTAEISEAGATFFVFYLWEEQLGGLFVKGILLTFACLRRRAGGHLCRAKTDTSRHSLSGCRSGSHAGVKNLSCQFSAQWADETNESGGQKYVKASGASGISGASLLEERPCFRGGSYHLLPDMLQKERIKLTKAASLTIRDGAFVVAVE